MTSSYLIYGANGYTGELIAREAKRRGHTPILAGRNAPALARLAEELGFSQRVFGLDEPSQLAAGLAGVQLVLNCAGPFSRTARQMVQACLHTRTHYLDITGEIEQLETLAARDAEAKASGIALLPAVGFDVVPTDCLAAHLKRRLPSATHVALGFQGPTGMSRGTALTTLEGLGKPSLVRRDGVLTEVPMGEISRTVDFGHGPTTALAIPWGDVATAYHSTGIPNIAVFVGMPSIMKYVLKGNALLAPWLRSPQLQGWLASRVRAGRSGPSAEQRAVGRSYLWGEARDAAGTVVTSRLQTPEGYGLTVLTALAAIEKLLAGPVATGFLTPSKAFGPDFILEIPSTQRSDD